MDTVSGMVRAWGRGWGGLEGVDGRGKKRDIYHTSNNKVKKKKKVKSSDSSLDLKVTSCFLLGKCLLQWECMPNKDKGPASVGLRDSEVPPVALSLHYHC